MRRAEVAAVVAGALALAMMAGSAGAETVAGGHSVSVPLPALNHDAIEGFTVTVTAPKGHSVGRPRVRTLNNAQLGNESIVYVIAGPHKPGAKATFTVYALIKRFGSLRRVARVGEGGVLQVGFVDAGEVHFKPVKDHSGDCEALARFNTEFESGPSYGAAGAQDEYLVSGRPADVQTSDPEEVLDQIVDDAWGSCPGAPETFDSGPH
ncbi:MAG TPA: hypothetical protein VGG88_03325 [Gaiellaceae bacterium]